MIKVNKRNLTIIEKELEFYDFKELSPKKQKQWLVRFKDSVDEITYSDLQFGGDENKYKEKEKILLELLHELFMSFEDEYCIIKNSEERWVMDTLLSDELKCILENNQILKGFTSAIFVKKNHRIVKLFAESVFRYNSFVQFIFRDERIVISPSDHLDIFIASDNLKVLEKKILECMGDCKEDLLEVIER